MIDRYILLGGGGHAAVVADMLLLLFQDRYSFVYVDDVNRGPLLHCIPWLCTLEELAQHLSKEQDVLVLAVGDVQLRRKWIDTLPASWWCPPIVHPSSTVSPFASLGKGTVVMAHAVVQARASTGAHCILNTACSVDHDCVLADNVHCAPGTHLAGGVCVEEDVLLGVGSCVLPRARIGARCVVGLGSKVLVDVPCDRRVYGTVSQSSLEGLLGGGKSAASFSSSGGTLATHSGSANLKSRTLQNSGSPGGPASLRKS